MTHDTTSPTGGVPSLRRQVLLACLAIGLVCLIILMLYLTICIGRRGNAAAVQTSPIAPEIHEYTVDQFSALAGYLSDDLDEGRLRVAPPADWYVVPRAKDYIVQFVFDRTRQSPLPRITIEARDANFRQPRDVTRANLPAFLERYTGSLDRDTRQAAEGRVLMLMIGDVPCVVYTLNKRFRDGNREYAGEREVLVTLRNGRLYTVTLDVYAGKMELYNGDVFAVVAGLRFLPPASPDKEQPSGDKARKTADRESGTTDAGKAESTPDAR